MDAGCFGSLGWEERRGGWLTGARATAGGWACCGGPRRGAGVVIGLCGALHPAAPLPGRAACRSCTSSRSEHLKLLPAAALPRGDASHPRSRGFHLAQTTSSSCPLPPCPAATPCTWATPTTACASSVACWAGAPRRRLPHASPRAPPPNRGLPALHGLPLRSVGHRRAAPAALRAPAARCALLARLELVSAWCPGLQRLLTWGLGSSLAHHSQPRCCREAELDALIEDSQRRFQQAHLTDDGAIASAAAAAAAADGGSAATVKDAGAAELVPAGVGDAAGAAAAAGPAAG